MSHEVNEPTPPIEDSIEDKLWKLGINYGYFWMPTLDQEPEEDRLNREAFLGQVLALIESELDSQTQEAERFNYDLGYKDAEVACAKRVVEARVEELGSIHDSATGMIDASNLRDSIMERILKLQSLQTKEPKEDI